jgi:hypothetical protein
MNLEKLSEFIRKALEKGKNLAKKRHAKQLEWFAQENGLAVPRKQREHDLSLAALDKRLAAHQEAHVLWTELMGSTELKEKAEKIVMKCENWWNNNSPYLNPEVREAFRSAYMATFRHPDLLAQNNGNWEEIKHNFETIRKAGDVIFKAVSLPSWGGKE